MCFPRLPFHGEAALRWHLQQSDCGFLCPWSLTECPHHTSGCTEAPTWFLFLPFLPTLHLQLLHRVTPKVLTCHLQPLAVQPHLLSPPMQPTLPDLLLPAPFASSERSLLGLTLQSPSFPSCATYRVHLTLLWVCRFPAQRLTPMWHFFILHDSIVLPARLSWLSQLARIGSGHLCFVHTTRIVYPPLPPFHCFIGLTNTSWLFKLIFVSFYVVCFIYFVLFKPHPIL